MTAIDTNVLVALWDLDPVLNSTARQALDLAFERGALIICGAVFAELLAAPGRNKRFVRSFLNDTGVAVDWVLEEPIWESAGLAFQAYSEGRKKQGHAGPRRILADFVIGAHASYRRHRLLTFDDRFYSKSFPGLTVQSL